ncbi:large-conductance mechanosensitive channel [Scenedesmus sp. NREL 46B-D3]|nr:large-conductance mechanosensitive channel [Scenedesmus sp. NREL 46B-D3]
MARIKLETLGAGFKSIDSGLTTLGRGAVGVGGTVGGTVTAVGGTVTNAVSSGLTGVFSLGRGFRDFILRGTVVELAVAVVLGTAFTNLISAVTSDWITPLIGAIFKGANFWDLSFELNGSTFRYGHFINELVMFMLVCLILYFGVVLPLNKLQYAAFKYKAIMRDCPYCLEEISMAATRCKHCCGEIEHDEEMQQVMQMAEAAMDAQEQKQSRCMRMLRCCVRSDTAVLCETAEGDVQLKQVQEAELPNQSSSLTLHTLARTRTRSGSMSGGGQRSGGASAAPSRMLSTSVSEVYRPPNTSFTQSHDCTALDVRQLEAAATQTLRNK